MELFGFFAGTVLGIGLLYVHIRVLWHLGSFLKEKTKKESQTRL